MHAWSRRLIRLIGAVIVAGAAAGGPWASSSAVGTEAATTGAEPTAGFERGMELFRSERYTEALPHFVTAQEEAAAQFGRGSREYATALNNLAEVYRLMERYDAAEPLFLEALAIEEARLGADDPGLARPLNNLGLMYRAQGRYAEAERSLVRSLAILEEVLGRRHPDVAGSLNNLARLHESKGEYERAEPLLERALSIADDLLGPAHPATQQITTNLARVRAALAAAPADADEATTVAEGSESGFDRAVRPPTQLVLQQAPTVGAATVEPAARGPILLWPPREEAPALPVAQPTEPAAQVAAAEAQPEAAIAEPEPEPEPEPAAGPAPAAISAAPVPAEPPVAAPAVATQQPAAAIEDELALLLPLPETRPSGWRWAKLPAGRFAIHLASVRSPISANEEWERLRGILDLPGDIGQLEPERIEIADQGVFYRVLGGPFASQAEAIAACRPIRDTGDFCAVLGAGG